MLNDMKDMLASLLQYQEQREKVCRSVSRGTVYRSNLRFGHSQFSLHLSMTQECMDIYQQNVLFILHT
jgi:hypothetical protein